MEPTTQLEGRWRRDTTETNLEQIAAEVEHLNAKMEDQYIKTEQALSQALVELEDIQQDPTQQPNKSGRRDGISEENTEEIATTLEKREKESKAVTSIDKDPTVTRKGKR